MNLSPVSSTVEGIQEKLLGKLLVAYDGFPASETALQIAMSLARTFHSFVNIVYVEDPRDVESELEGGLGQVRESRRQRSLDLQCVAERFHQMRIGNCVWQQSGSVGDVLVQLASESQADLLLMGAYGNNRIERTLLGTTAEFILRSMPCAVMTIGPGTLFDDDRKADHGSILLHASSLPEKPGLAIDYLRVLAKAYGASVEIIHVIDDFAKIRDHRAFSELRTAGESLVGKLQRFDVNASLKLRCGHQSDVIIDTAEMIDASLIIFGLEHPTSSPYVTGVIGRTIQEASCPVLTIPGPA